MRQKAFLFESGIRQKRKVGRNHTAPVLSPLRDELNKQVTRIWEVQESAKLKITDVAKINVK